MTYRVHCAVTSTGAPGTAGRRTEAMAIVQILLAAGADAEQRSRLGRPPVEYVADAEMLALFGVE